MSAPFFSHLWHLKAHAGLHSAMHAHIHRPGEASSDTQSIGARAPGMAASAISACITVCVNG